MQELKANPNLPARGTIIEAQLDKGRGPVATVLVQRGTLHIGDTIVAGTAYGKVRAMVNDRGEKVKKAGPSTPVEVLGLNDVPGAGDVLDSTDERTARSVAEKRVAKRKEDEMKLNSKVSLDDLFQRIQEGELKELNIVVKADVQGTIEALKASLEKSKTMKLKLLLFTQVLAQLLNPTLCLLPQQTHSSSALTFVLTLTLVKQQKPKKLTYALTA